MFWGLLAVSLGLLLGGGVGYLAGLIRVHPVWQSATAGLVATGLAMVAMVGVAILRERAAGFRVFNARGPRHGASAPSCPS